MIDELSAGDAPRVMHSGASAQRRARCIWLGTLASWRGGLVRRLVGECGSVSDLLDRSPERLASLIRPPGVATRKKKVDATSASRRLAREREQHAAERHAEEARFAGILKARPEDFARTQERLPHSAVVAWCDPLYPPALRQLADPPLCLFVRARCGDQEIRRRLRILCDAPVVAVVGTRAPSPYGTEMAWALGRDLTVRGVLVVSGLALGIDATAQAAAIAAAKVAQELATVAVLGCGPDVVYPHANARLREEVARRGLLVSEFAWGVPARPWRFPARNRVMAGLSRGVVVVEGASRSGARITAGFALELGSRSARSARRSGEEAHGGSARSSSPRCGHLRVSGRRRGCHRHHASRPRVVGRSLRYELWLRGFWRKAQTTAGSAACSGRWSADR